MATTKKSTSKENVEKAQDASEPILIKKYPNRRLYNTATSSYIVLDDVIKLVKSDTPFVIRDKKTGDDITRSILNQIIFEQEIKPSNFHFPLEVQKQLISMYGDTYGAMVPDYLTESMKLFAAERTKMGSAVESIVERNTKAMLEFSQNMARQNMELFRKSWQMFGGKDVSTTETVRQPEKAEPNRSKDKHDELNEIQAKIDALQERLKSLK